MKYRTMIHLNFSYDGSLQQHAQADVHSGMRTIHLPPTLVSSIGFQPATMRLTGQEDVLSFGKTVVLTALLFRRKVALFGRSRN
jgi:hypothetical protein